MCLSPKQRNQLVEDLGYQIRRSNFILMLLFQTYNTCDPLDILMRSLDIVI